MYRIVIIFFLLLFAGFCKAAKPVPEIIATYIKTIDAGKIGDKKPVISYKVLTNDLVYVQVAWTLVKNIRQDDVHIKITPNYIPTFHWAPMLAPDSSHVMAQHIFRSPALIVTNAKKNLSIIPDLDKVGKITALNWYMDMNALENYLAIGISKTTIKEHVLYTKDTGTIFPKGQIIIGFYCIVSDKKEDIQNPFHKTVDFMWSKWGVPLYKKAEPLHTKNLEPFVQQTYDWAFKNWKQAVWQEFELNGKKVGAPVFIVNTTQSPNYKGQVDEREFRSVWNQAWFNSLRSAQGLYRFAIRHKNDSLKNYALLTKELALAFPQEKGFFKSVVATEMETITIAGKKYNRSKGWRTLYFGNSNRNPYTWDPRSSPYHIADMSFTAYWMLVWYNELEKDKRLLQYATNYADALVNIQRPDGFFPAWLDLETLKQLDQLNQSPETSISITFLLQLYQLTNNKKYLSSAIKAMNAVTKNIIPVGQWEDFETYWSCSRIGADKWVGKKVVRNDMFKQNTFSIFWTAQALLEMYKTTADKKYIEAGHRTLDELLMWQAVWQPSFIAIHSLGGFGVMNGDAEWNDSRQSLFAELIVAYGKLLNNTAYMQRGLAALRASFTMMYTPELPQTMVQWQSRWPFFGKADYGFMMENYGHDGVTNNKGLGIGEFTIYDWGNGAAAEAYNRMLDHYGAGIFMQ